MPRAFLAIALLIAVTSRLPAQETVRLQEAFAPGYRYHVSSRVELTGNLTPPTAKGQPASTPVTISGNSAIDYDERVLAVEADGNVSKSCRLYRRVDLKRKVGERNEESGLRNNVRRLVILRLRNAEVPFSPDGPLTWSEIELVRTDVFTPALTGLLPDAAVKPGDRWHAKAAAIQELTDMEKIEAGTLDCRLEQVTLLSGRRHARVAISGSIRGVNEDGPNRQEIVGYFFFDLESNHLSYLSFKGTHILMDGEGKEAGKIEGQFVLTRQAHTQVVELSDEALRGVAIEPNAENTQLLYDNADLGVRFLYPRRWRVGGVQGRQVTVDDTAGGGGLLITLEPFARVPAAAQFQAEVRGYFGKQQAKVVRLDPPRVLAGGVEYFTLDVEMAGQKATMDYYLIRQPLGGAVLAARLTGDLNSLRGDVDRIAKSLTVTTQQR